MKIRTNLESNKLRALAKGLNEAAELQDKDKAPALENSAEKALMKEVDSSFSMMLDSLQVSVGDILQGN